MLATQNDYFLNVKEFTKILGLSRTAPYNIFKTNPEIFKLKKLKRKNHISANSLYLFRKKGEDIHKTYQILSQQYQKNKLMDL